MNKQLTPYMRAKTAHTWLYRGVCVRILREQFGSDIVDRIRELSVNRRSAALYDTNTVEALIVNNKDPQLVS